METPPKIKKFMSEDEVYLLIKLIQSKSILTSKETTALTNKLKEDAWTSLTDEFNATFGTNRQKEQLKFKWDNLKKAARKRSQQIRMNKLKTGDETPDYISPDEILDKVSSLLGLSVLNTVHPKREIDVDLENRRKFVLSIPTTSKPFQKKGKKWKVQDNGQRELNLALARYYQKKTEKLELEIKFLKERADPHL